MLRETPDGYLFLMLRAFRHWDFPKGLVEAGETPMQAAVREIREETTINDMSFPWGESYFDTGPYNRGKVARYFIGLTKQERIELPVNEELGRPEHSEFRWVEISEALDLASPRVSGVIDWACRVINIT